MVKFLKTLKSGQKIDFSMTSKETGESLFQTVVDENYTKLLSYMVVNKIDLTMKRCLSISGCT